ncbi:MAG TPA: hypothetical protein VNG33_09985 [Polyangiaceae bacterium]|nr:hypothetical protein [Polyangiaceae bacterium]
MGESALEESELEGESKLVEESLLDEESELDEDESDFDDESELDGDSAPAGASALSGDSASLGGVQATTKNERAPRLVTARVAMSLGFMEKSPGPRASAT